MSNHNRELWAAVIAISLITLAYILVVTWFSSVPPAYSLFGHSLGVLGLIMMLMTETLYSLRKRSRSAKWGKMARWLEFHIFTGLVGPYMAMLHTAWKFNGLAGLVLLMMIIVVLSGFIGRYIYTAVPRTADGVEIEADQIREMIARFEAELQLANRPVPAEPANANLSQRGRQLSAAFDPPLPQEIATRPRHSVPAEKKASKPSLTREQKGYLRSLRRKQRTLERQLSNLAWARRMLAIWHAVHVPLGMAMFTAVFFHIAAALYYATLLH